MFYGVDPHAENYMSFSPYAYVGNNPLIRIDPDGRDWFGINQEDGTIILLKPTEGNHRLYAGSGTNKDDFIIKGRNDFLEIKDKTMLPQLSEKTNMATAIQDGSVFSGPVANTLNSKEAYKIFKYAAKNSGVEWSYQEFIDGSAAVATANMDWTTISGLDSKTNHGKVVAFDIHSHPGDTKTDLEPWKGGGRDYLRKDIFKYQNPNVKVWIYMPKAPNPNARMLDIVNNKWIIQH